MYTWKFEASEDAAVAEAEIRPEYEAAAAGRTKLNPVTRQQEPQIAEMQRSMIKIMYTGTACQADEIRSVEY